MRVMALSSGTSMDGVDVAIADLDQHGEDLLLSPLAHQVLAYPDELAVALRSAVDDGDGGPGEWCRLDTEVGRFFANVGAGFRDTTAAGGIDLVVSHGQTVHHWVEGGVTRGTLQIGQPAWIAERLGAPVIFDVRSRDVAAGGGGAPLVSMVDDLLLADVTEPTVALNLGGIANVTVVRPHDPAIAFDVGPANALLDAAMLSRGDERFDRDGARAIRGTIDSDLRKVLVDDEFLGAPPPKTTGRERYNQAFLEAALTEAPVPSLDDVLATVTDVVAASIGDVCRTLEVASVVVSGGGVHNTALMAGIGRHVAPASLTTSAETWGLDGDAKEAYAFAVIGWATWHGLPANIPSCTGADGPRLLGAIVPGPKPLPLREVVSTPPRRLLVATTSPRVTPRDRGDVSM